MSSAAERREELKAVWQQAQACTTLPAARRRPAQTVVFGSGNADADLMFVGEAPGANEDKQGLPFVGQAGRLLDTLLERDRPRRAATSSSPTSSNAARPATATRCRRRSTPARTTCSASSS